LSEVYYPGWEAYVDGDRTPIERVNYTFRGILVPAGEHRVEFRFRPSTLRLGWLAFALGAGILVFGALFDARRIRTLASP
jgi:uncharacterized membrane protein YfhO